MEKTVTIWGKSTVFPPTKYTRAEAIPKNLAVAQCINIGDKLLFKTLPDGTITMEKVIEEKL